ncbi:MAG: phospho-sugar mutase [Oscillospiraceae bacterium]|jgi:phosphoglucomutase|nr:phospho-sugar mutase [Oscillospiraceae bacterium]
MTINQKYALWLKNAAEDPDLIAELNSIEGEEKKLEERFKLDLEFGTAGLRGEIGAGTFRMNIYTIRRATQGLADYIIKKSGAKPSIAIAYDSRIKSDLFAQEAARVMAANGIKAYIFPELQPTPVLSFAVRHLKTDSGIVVTASHNPSEYNGYKVYGSDGCQMTDDAADAVLANINATDIFTGVKVISFEEGLASGLIEWIDDSVLTAYLEAVKACSVNPDAAKSSSLKVIFTPLHGTGNKPVRRVLAEIGLENVTVVPEQELPDGNFPTAPYPNPEKPQPFELALELAKTVKPDLIVATDPDADRMGIAVAEKDGYKLLSGNEVGCLLLNYILESRKANGTLPANPVAVTTIVSTPLATAIGKKHGVDVITVLTGFKYIGEQILLLEQKGEENRFILGFEESYGYLGGTYARDKDAVIASMLICEMAAFYKKNSKSLLDVLEGIYKDYGIYYNKVEELVFKGLDGMEQMKSIMEKLRQNPPSELGGFKVTSYSDYLTHERLNTASGVKETINLPKSNVLEYQLSDNNKVIVRPSGTEPKIKIYLTANAETLELAQGIAAGLKGSVDDLV